MVHDKISQSLNREIRMSSDPPPPSSPLLHKGGGWDFSKMTVMRGGWGDDGKFLQNMGLKPGMGSWFCNRGMRKC